jgi:integrase
VLTIARKVGVKAYGPTLSRPAGPRQPTEDDPDMPRAHKARLHQRLTDLMIPKLKCGPLRSRASGDATTEAYAPKAYPDGDGLYLVCTSPTSRHWSFRYKLDKRERVMGLGSYPAVSLATARELAGVARKMKQSGIDPIEQRRAATSDQEAASAAKAAAAEAKARTFKVCALEWYGNNRDSWSNAKYQSQVWDAIERYALPVIGDMPIDEVQPANILAVVTPHWSRARETMSRLRTNIAGVFSMAKAKEWRTGDNPAAWADNLQHLLPKRARSEAVNHLPAMPYEDIPAFMAELRKQDLVSARCLEFTILNASRTSESTGARWAEMDQGARIWTIPSERIKARRQHKVLLCDRSIEILKVMEGLSPDYVFPSRDGRAKLSDNAMLLLLDRMGHGNITAHGFRSAFKDWAREQTNFPNEASEISLAHSVGDKTERAYARGAMLKKRRQMMEAWANYCTREPVSNVVPLGQAKRQPATA